MRSPLSRIFKGANIRPLSIVILIETKDYNSPVDKWTIGPQAHISNSCSWCQRIVSNLIVTKSFPGDFSQIWGFPKPGIYANTVSFLTCCIAELPYRFI